MKKLHYLVLLFFSASSFAQINISTGAGSPGPGTIDVNWKVATALPVSGPAYVIAGHALWQATPVPVTGARWINFVNGLQTPCPKVYIYERKITVPAGIKRLKYDFKVGVDDALNSLEIINPNAVTKPLTAVFTANFKLSQSIIDSIMCPEGGVWTIRARVLCADQSPGASGFLLSGYVDFEGECYNPCCPPWNVEMLRKFMVYKGTGSISDPYTLVFQPSASHQSQMQAYLNYVHSIKPCVTKLYTEFRLHDQGTGNTPSMAGWGPLIGNLAYCNYTWNTTGASSLSPASPINVFPIGGMVVGTWYAVLGNIYLADCDYFPKECADKGIYVRIQVLNAKAAPGQKQEGNAILEFSNGKQIVGSMPLK